MTRSTINNYNVEERSLPARSRSKRLRETGLGSVTNDSIVVSPSDLPLHTHELGEVNELKTELDYRFLKDNVLTNADIETVLSEENVYSAQRSLAEDGKRLLKSEVISSEDTQTKLSNDNVFSALRSVRQFINKEGDTVSGIIDFLSDIKVKGEANFNKLAAVMGAIETLTASDIDSDRAAIRSAVIDFLQSNNITAELIRSTNYAAGITGHGYSINNEGEAELKSLFIREFLEATEFRYNRVTVIAGESWRGPGAGLIKSVDTKTQTITLKLEEGELATIDVDDICKGIYHTSTGFTTVFFRITEKMAEDTFKYVLRSGYTMHPQMTMSFIAYGNFTNKSRQQSCYEARNYKRYLANINDWDIQLPNIMMQLGDLSGLKTEYGLDMTGYSAYLNRVYMTGTIKQLSQDGVTEVPVPAFKGAWTPVKYYYYDEVVHMGCRWLCIVQTTTQEPSDDKKDWLKVVDKGDTGLSGAMLRPRGEWKPNTRYIKDDQFRDTVMYKKNKYIVKNTHTSGASFVTTPWEEFNEFINVATQVLLADQAWIDILGAQGIAVGESAANRWELTNGRIRHTKTGLELSSEGRIIAPSGGILFASGKTVEDTINDNVNTIQIGGRNIVRDSLINITSPEYGFAPRSVYLEQGVTYTMSVSGFCNAIAVSEGKYLRVYLNNNDWSFQVAVDIRSTISSVNSAAVIPPTSGTYSISAYMYPSAGLRNGEVTFEWIKLEKGNKATDWTPAPEDTTEEINAAVDTLNGYVDGVFKDEVVSEAEAKAIEKHLNELNMTMASVEATYNKLFTNSYLEGDAKTTLLNTKINLFSARDNLRSAITSAIADGKTTVAEKANVDAKFATFNSNLSSFQSAVEDANKAIQNKLDRLSSDKVNNIQIGGRNLVQDSMIKMSSSLYGFAPRSVYLEQGVTYVMSVSGFCNATAVSEGKYLRVYLNNNDWSFQAAVDIRSTASTINRALLTPTASGAYSISAYMFPDGGGRNGAVTLEWIKLEKGNTATDWSPAPEDINYLKEAIKGDTNISGGLVMSNVMAVRGGTSNTEDDIIAGMSGLKDDGVFFFADVRNAYRKAINYFKGVSSEKPLFGVSKGGFLVAMSGLIGCFRIARDLVTIQNAAGEDKVKFTGESIEKFANNTSTITGGALGAMRTEYSNSTGAFMHYNNEIATMSYSFNLSHDTVFSINTKQSMLIEATATAAAIDLEYMRVEAEAYLDVGYRLEIKNNGVVILNQVIAADRVEAATFDRDFLVTTTKNVLINNTQSLPFTKGTVEAKLYARYDMQLYSYNGRGTLSSAYAKIDLMPGTSNALFTFVSTTDETIIGSDGISVKLDSNNWVKFLKKAGKMYLLFSGEVSPESNIPALICGGEVNTNGDSVYKTGGISDPRRENPGYYKITLPNEMKGKGNYIVQLTGIETDNIVTMASRDPANNWFYVKTYNTPGVLEDAAFSYMVYRAK